MAEHDHYGDVCMCVNICWLVGQIVYKMVLWGLLS